MMQQFAVIDDLIKQTEGFQEYAHYKENELAVLKARIKWLKTECRKKQIIPEFGDWLIFLICAGRGWGKTRVGAEDTWWYAYKNPKSRLAVVAPTKGDVRDVCFEGQSGIMNVVPPQIIASYNRTLFELVLTNGSIIKGYSAEEPNRLRGPQHHRAWGDEIGSWQYAQETYDQLNFGLRLGNRPQMVLTSTPYPTPLFKDLLQKSQVPGSGVLLRRGYTHENIKNLAPSFMRTITDRYADTRLGMQELFAQLLTDVPGALWSFSQLDDCRVSHNELPQMKRIVVAIDPSVTSRATSDETGIVVAGLGENDCAYVLEDCSAHQAKPSEWVSIAIAAYTRWNANSIIAEANNGGEMIKDLFTHENDRIPVKLVHASQGKYARAEPASVLYQKGRVKHCGVFPKLESQMCSYVQAGAKKSPDRMDALVWALAELLPATAAVHVPPEMIFSIPKIGR